MKLYILTYFAILYLSCLQVFAEATYSIKPLELVVGFESQLDVDYSDYETEQSFNDYIFELEYKKLFKDRSILKAKFASSYRDYDFSGPSTDQLRFDDLEFYSLSLDYRANLNDSWTYVGAAGIRAGRELGASMSDGLSAMFRFTLAYNYSRNFNIFVGAISITELENSDSIMPILGLRWKINNEWTFMTLNGVKLSYSPQNFEKHSFDASILFDVRQYRLEDKDRMERSLSVRAIPFTFAYSYQYNESLSIRSFIKADLGANNEWRQEGRQVEKYDLDTAISLGFTFNYSFAK